MLSSLAGGGKRARATQPHGRTCSGATMPKYACCSDVPFQNLVRFLDCFERAKTNQHKDEHMREFRKKNVVRPSADIYAIYRLLLPGVRPRAACLVSA